MKNIVGSILASQTLQASAQDIIRHPNVRRLRFGFALTQKERKIVYDKLGQTGTVSGWDCNYSHLHILDRFIQVIPMASEVTCQLLENASARFEQITAEL